MKGSVVERQLAILHSHVFFSPKFSKLILSHFMRHFASLQYFNESWPSPLSAVTHGKPVLPHALSCIALNGIFFFFFFKFISSTQSLNTIPIVWLKFQSCRIYLGFNHIAMDTWT